MREIIVTVKPSLADISEPSRLSRVIGDVQKLIEANLDLCIETVAEKALEFARENAETGYQKVEYSGNRTVVWAPRDPVTERLYEISPYHSPSVTGLSAGADRLFDSLVRSGVDNIFEKVGLSVKVGTRFEHAHLLEKGGIRPSLPNIGFNDDGSVKMWLLKAVISGLISWNEVSNIRQQIFTPQFMPARPFLYPAMWYMQDTETHTAICSDILLKEMQASLDIGEIPNIIGDSVFVPQ